MLGRPAARWKGRRWRLITGISVLATIAVAGSLWWALEPSRPPQQISFLVLTDSEPGEEKLVSAIERIKSQWDQHPLGGQFQLDPIFAQADTKDIEGVIVQYAKQVAFVLADGSAAFVEQAAWMAQRYEELIVLPYENDASRLPQRQCYQICPSAQDVASAAIRTAKGHGYQSVAWLFPQGESNKAAWAARIASQYAISFIPVEYQDGQVQQALAIAGDAKAELLIFQGEFDAALDSEEIPVLFIHQEGLQAKDGWLLLQPGVQNAGYETFHRLFAQQAVPDSRLMAVYDAVLAGIEKTQGISVAYAQVQRFSSDGFAAGLFTQWQYQAGQWQRQAVQSIEQVESPRAVGVLMPQENASANWVREGINIAVEMMDRERMPLLYYEEYSGKENVCLEGYESLMEQEVGLIIACVDEADQTALIKANADSGVPILFPLNGVSAVTLNDPLAIPMMPSKVKQGEMLCRFTRKKAYSRVALVYAGDREEQAYGYERAFYMENHHGEQLVYKAAWDTVGQTPPIVDLVKAKPDAILYIGDAQGFKRLLADAKDSGITADILAGGGIVNERGDWEATAQALNLTIYLYEPMMIQQGSTAASFQLRFQTLFSQQACWEAAAGFDAIMLAGQSLALEGSACVNIRQLTGALTGFHGEPNVAYDFFELTKDGIQCIWKMERDTWPVDP